MNRSRLANLSEAQIHVMREADRIERDVKRTESKIRKANKKARSKSLNLEVAKAALDGVTAKFREPHKQDEPYLRFLRLCPCLFCRIKEREQAMPTEAAHVRRAYPRERGWRPVGGGETPHDFRALPQCVEHHRQGKDAQHAHDNHDWYADRGVYPPEVCAELMRAHLAGADPVEAVETIAAEIRATGFSPSRARKHAEEAR